MRRFLAVVMVMLTVLSSAIGLSACSPNRKIKNVIIVIGDGMGLKHITAGSLYIGEDLCFESWPSVKVNTASLNTELDPKTPTDSAAAGTALASGMLTYNGCVGIDENGGETKTILDFAKDEGKSTGVVSTDLLTGATPGAFSGHSDSRSNEYAIAASQLGSGVDLLCASVSEAFTERVDEIEANGYAYCDSADELDATLQANQRVLCQLDMYGVNASVKLPTVTKKALDFLDRDEDGFVLMVEQAHVDKYSHNNDYKNMQKSVADLNDTVKAILEWVGDREDTAILITADHETGGLTLSSGTGAWTTTNHTTADVGLFTYGIEVDYAEFSYYGKENRIKNAEVFELALGLVSKDALKSWREQKALLSEE